MKKYIVIFLLLCTSVLFAAPDPGIYPPWYKLKAYIQNGMLTDITIEGDITLENDEEIWNSTDAEVEIQFDDDATVLGSFIISSAMTTAEIANNNLFQILFRSVDGGDVETDYGEIEVVMTDTTGGSEDSNILFKTLQAGGSVTPLTLSGDNITVADDAEINGNITLENDEQFINSTDAEVEITFNDDAVLLGSFIVNSSNTAVSANDYLEMIFRSVDNGALETDYGEIEVMATNVTGGAEASSMTFKTLQAAGSVSPLILAGDNATFADDVEMNGLVTLENDEQILNSTDAEIEFIGNDNAVTLMSMIINSSMTIAEIAPNDVYKLIFRSVDGLSNETDYGELNVTLLDTTHGSEDSNILLKTFESGASATPLTLTGADGLFGDDLIITDDLETNGLVTLENDEAIWNSTDAEVEVQFNDDAVVLGNFIISSAMTIAELENNNLFQILFRSVDGGGVETDYGEIEVVLTDTTGGSEDSNILFKTLEGAASVTPLTLSGDNATFADDVVITDDLETNGLVTLQNDEAIWNSTDVEVEVQFDDDAVTLGNFIISSSMTSAELENNNLFQVIFRSVDGLDNETDYGEIEVLIADTTDGSEDSQITFKTFNAGATASPLVMLGNDAVFADDVEINGNVTLENDEKILNSTNAEIEFIGNDNAATLLSMIVNSSMTVAELAPNDVYKLIFRSVDGGSNETDYGELNVTLLDTTDGTEDSNILFKALEAGGSVTPLSLIGGDATFGDDVIITDDLETNGLVTLENDEAIWNSTDAEVEVQFNDDAITLGSFIFSSSMTVAELENNNLFKLFFRSVDGGGVETDYGEIHVVIADTTGGSEDSNILFKTLEGSSSVTPLTLSGNNATFADDVEINGDITGENDEKVLNSTDAELEILFDDNAATLGALVLNSSMTVAEIAPNDLYEILFRSVDGGSNETDYIEIEAQIVDTTDTTEDSKITFKTLNAGASASPLILESNTALVGGTLEVEGVITVANSVVSGTATFFSGASADTVLIAGATTNSIYITSFTSDPGTPGAHWTESKADTLIIHTAGAVTATPSWAWIRIEKD